MGQLRDRDAAAGIAHVQLHLGRRALDSQGERAPLRHRLQRIVAEGEHHTAQGVRMKHGLPRCVSRSRWSVT